MQKIMPKMFGRNIWNESTIRIHSSTVKGGKDIWHPKGAEVSCKKLSGPKSDLNLLLFWPPASEVSTSSTASLHRNEQHQWIQTKQNNKRNRNSTFITSKALLSLPKSIFVQFDLEILELNFKSERASKLTWKSSPAQIHTKWLWGAVDDQMLPSTDWIQCVFQKVPLTQWDVCTFFKKILSGFFAWRQIRISSFVSQFHSCKIPSSSSNATLYTIRSIIQDYTWNVSRFPNLFHCFKSLLKMQSVCNFGTWDTTYVGVVSLNISVL